MGLFLIDSRRRGWQGSDPEAYLSCLLRLWSTEGETGGVWRASLVDPLTGIPKGFRDPETLFGFLREQMVMRVTRFEKEGGDADSPSL
jgi:hypothetical protein